MNRTAAGGTGVPYVEATPGLLLERGSTARSGLHRNLETRRWGTNACPHVGYKVSHY